MGAEAVIGIIVGVGGFIFGLVTFFRNKKADDSSEGRKDGTILTELGYIKSGVDDIKRKQEKQDEQNLKFAERLTSVEASAKQAHKRLDKIEGTTRER